MSPAGSGSGDPDEGPPVIRDKRRLDPLTGELRQPADPAPSTPQTPPPPPPQASGGAGGLGGPADVGTPLTGEVVEDEDPRDEELRERLEDLRRVTAEYANYRRRAERDRAQLSQVATATVLTGLLEVLDDVDRARSHGDLVGAFATVAENLEKAVARMGLERFGAPSGRLRPHGARGPDGQPVGRGHRDGGGAGVPAGIPGGGAPPAPGAGRCLQPGRARAGRGGAGRHGCARGGRLAGRLSRTTRDDAEGGGEAVSQRDYLEKDYYKTLGVPSSASAADVKKAYRKLARELHPDANPGDSTAEQRFAEVSEAYDVLADTTKRKEYDEVRRLVAAGGPRRARPGAAGPGAGGFDVGDLFGQARAGAGGIGDLLGGLFGGGAAGRARPGSRRGRDVESAVTLNFLDAARGTTVPLRLTSPTTCGTCHGSGAAPGTSPTTCSTCGGVGTTTRNQGGFAFAEPCRTCMGAGTTVATPCPTCSGSGQTVRDRTLTVRIPAGVDDGQRIRLAGKGEPGAGGAPAGDLFVSVSVRPHPLFSRSGDDLLLTVPVTFAEAVAGTTITVPTLKDPVTLRVPPGTASGRTLRAKGRGVARRSGAGDLLVTVTVHVPSELSPEAREALDAYAALEGAEPRAALAEHLP